MDWPSRLQNTIASCPVVDVHEHHIPGVVDAPHVGLLELLRQSYAGWTQRRPYPLPSESRLSDPMLEELKEARPGRWEDVRCFLEDSGSNMFVRNLLGALARLHQWEPPGITRENWRRIDRRIRASRADRNWRHEVLNRAGVQAVITDNYTDPVMAVKPRLGASYFSVLRINGFAFGWDDRACDHNGNNGRRLLERLGIAARTFDDYMDGLETVVRLMPERGQVALKNALAYDRDLDFEPPDLVLARQAWGLPDPSPAARKAFGDFVVDRLCALAARHDIPVQIHLGTAVIRGSHPLKLASLVERHPRTQFLLMHLAYPWSRDLLGMAFVYRNIWLDLTWAPLLSPSHFKLALHEAIELLPDESRMMVGGDNWHVEETFGAIHTVRQCLADVLVEKVRSGYFQLVDAERLARKILRRNAIGFFHLPFSL